MKKFTRLKYYYFLLAGILSVFQLSAQTTHVVTSSANFEFVPSFIQVMAGDTVNWQIDGIHNVIEVSLQSYNNNTATSNGGFTLPFGGGKQAFPNPGVYYYICQPHASLAMKGVIFVTSNAVETYTASLSGHQQSVPVITTGKGNVTATLDGTTLVIDGSFSNLDGDFNANIAGGAHLHKSIAGRNGGIEIGLTTNLNANMKSGSFLPDSNIYTITPAQAEAIRNREIYLNIHTTTHGPGEIRGQLLPSGTYYSTHLFGSFQRVPVISEGGGLLVLDLVGDTLTVSGSFDNLNSAFNSAVAGGAHLHNGLSGQNGGINIGLKATVDTDQLGGIFEADSNKFFVNAAQKASLEERRLYANIHTLTSPGRTRGQVVGMPQVVFRAFLSGANQPAPIVTAATGMAVLELKDDQLIVSGSFTGLESDFNINVAGGAHIHGAVAGRNGGISQGLTTNLDVNNRAGTFESGTNTYTVDSAQMANLFNRAMYVNIHTVNNGSGELRGQILPEANYYFQSQLSGTQAAPPVLSRGGGALLAEVRGNGLVISGSFDNLTGDYNPNIAGGSHLHGAYAGSNGPNGTGLTPTLDGDNLGGIYEPESNTYTLSTTLRDSVKRRLLYANIHTTAVGSGEVRGQMLAEANNYFYAPISGSSQRNPLDREATGTVAGEWLANQLIVSGSFRNLASDFNANVAGGAHLHSGLPGRNGPIIYPLNSDLSGDLRSGSFAADSNRFTLTGGRADTLRNRMLYANIHTTSDGSGEIRGNLLPAANAYFTTYASGKNQTVPVQTNGYGALKLELLGSKLRLSGSFDDLNGDFNPNAAGGVHLHGASAGTNGGIEVGLTTMLDGDLKGGVFWADSNLYDLTEPQITALMAGDLYLNIHTTTNASGEIRGQVLKESNFFPDSLPLISSPASGATVQISGFAATTFDATWSSSSEPDGNLLVYYWQLSDTSDFSSMIINRNVGSNPAFSTDFADIDSLLANAGVNVGDTVKLYHRAIASDGSLCIEGTLDSVMLVRGVVFPTSIEDLTEKNISVSPNPFSNTINLEMETDVPGDIRWSLIDLMGKEVQKGEFNLTTGKNKYELSIYDLPQGMYILTLGAGNQRILQKKLLKE